MLIRKAEERDIPEILTLLKQVGHVHRRIRPDIFRADAQKYDASTLQVLLQNPLRPIFVAQTDEQIAGYCFCEHKVCRGHSVFLDRSELYIDDLCVDEKCRQKGVATALYRHVQSYAKESGCDVLTLNVWCGNEQAQRFYEKMGMKSRNITMEQPL